MWNYIPRFTKRVCVVVQGLTNYLPRGPVGPWVGVAVTKCGRQRTGRSVATPKIGGCPVGDVTRPLARLPHQATRIQCADSTDFVVFFSVATTMLEWRILGCSAKNNPVRTSVSLL